MLWLHGPELNEVIRVGANLIGLVALEEEEKCLSPSPRSQISILQDCKR